MLADMIEIHALARSGKAVAGQVPDPGRAISHDQDFVGPAQAVTHGFRPELFFEHLRSAARHGVAATENSGASAFRPGALAQTKTGSPVGPMPAGRLLSFLAQGLALTPCV